MSDIKWLKDAIEKIDSKVDVIGEKVSDQNAILAKQSVILEDHTRRSLAAEENLDLLRQEARSNKSELEGKIAPIQSHVDKVQFLTRATIKIISISATIVGVMVAVVKLFL
mgnify:CR=1 FL=1